MYHLLMFPVPRRPLLQSLLLSLLMRLLAMAPLCLVHICVALEAKRLKVGGTEGEMGALCICPSALDGRDVMHTPGGCHISLSLTLGT